MCKTLDKIDEIQKNFKRFKGYVSPIQKPNATESAILLPLIEMPHSVDVLFVKRRNDIKIHPGEYSFPGGHIEQSDKNELFAALRETEEEIGHPAKQIEIIGKIGVFFTLTNFKIHAFAGVLKNLRTLKPQEEEIDKIVAIPLQKLCYAKWNKVEIPQELENVLPNIDVHEVIVDEHRIWGATARILRVFITSVSGIDPVKGVKT